MPDNSMDYTAIMDLLKPADESADTCFEAEWQPVGTTGIYAVEVDDELVLGINGAGYDFYTNHWAKLYDALGFQWHTPVPNALEE